MYRKIHGSFCEMEHYLEKLAVDCRVRAELLYGDWVMGLCIVYTQETFDHLCATWLTGQLHKIHVRFNNCKAAL